MKTLVLCYEYPPIGGGGGRVAKTVAEALVARGHEVRVQTAALGWQSSRETIGGVEVFRTASGRRLPERCAVHEMALYCLTSSFAVLRHVRDWQPDVIHAHFVLPTGALAWAVHQITGVPYVLTAHLGDVPGGAPGQTDGLFRFFGPVARWIWKKSAGATAVSAWVCELAAKAYSYRPTIIHNGVPLGATSPRPAENRPETHLVFVGRLNPQKCPLFLIDVLTHVPDRRWRLTVVGDGELMAPLRERVKSSGFADQVHLAGWMDAPAVAEVLHDADIFLLPSTFEGLPVAAVEALNHGLALLVSDITGVYDVVDDGVNGHRLPIGDAAAWAERLAHLLDHPEALTALREASWRKAQQFDLRHIAAEYEDVLAKAAKMRRPQSGPRTI